MVKVRSLSFPASRALLLFAALFVLFSFVWIRNAWLSDDAYITLRTVYNTLHGLGPDFNPGERVQSYTHPLWFLFLLVAHALTGEAYYSTLALSLLVSLATLFLFAKYLARTPQQALFGIGAMILSKAYIDFSSSGLENPLSQLCLALFLIPFFQTNYSIRRLFWAALLAALGTLARYDLILLYLPPLALVMLQTWQHNPQHRLRAIGALGAGFTPLVFWCSFALFYYGLILPNTYYAKTPANVPLFMWLNQGAKYFLNSLRLDPIALPLIVLALLLAIYARSLSLISLTLGISLYLVYVLRIGGDFMSGRFFTVPLFTALVILARVEPLGNSKYLIPLTLVMVLFSFFSPNPPLLSNETFGATTDPARIALVEADRITDQRAFYYHWTGLLQNLTGTANLSNITEVKDGVKFKSRKNRILRTTGIGLRGYYAGPTTYVVDEMALADPFLAWMPRKNGWWIIGHFPRCVPPGYAKTLNAKLLNPRKINKNRNLIEDSELAAFYDQISLLNRAKLFDPNRIPAILNVNLGKYDYLRNQIHPCENFYSGKPDPAITIAE